MTDLAKPFFWTLLLVLFAAAALTGGPSSDLETSIMRAVANLRADWPALTVFMAVVTTIGGAPLTIGIAAVASLTLLLRRAPAHALLLAVTVLVERQLVDGLKAWIGRPRPDFGLDRLPISLAYPSGHAANSMTAFLATALIAAPPAYRRPVAIAALILSLLVGLSRVWLGVHWPSDVIGGWALGLTAVGAALSIGQRSAAFRLESQHQIVGRHRPALGEDEAA